MKTHLTTDYSEDSLSNRSGATLTEVLMAILIMGIGMIGVISLFPAAVLRSVQAHALTSSTNLRFNAEASLALYPHILANPDRNVAGVRFHQTNGQSFMVDPMGILMHSIPDGDRLGGNGTMQRFSAGFSQLNTAEDVFSSADKWTIRYEGFPTSGSVDVGDNPQSLTFSDLSRQRIFIGANMAPTRLVIFNRNGDKCQVRDVDFNLPLNASPLGNTVGWTTRLPASYCGASLNAADIGNVRVEQRELTFTWLLTAKRQFASGATARYSTHLAMFHKRGYPPSDLDVFGNNGNDVFRKGSATANISFPPGTSPFLKRGSYVLDASSNGGSWYRIQEFVETAGSAQITLDEPATETSKAAVFMKGVVAVYRINDSTVDRIPFGYDEH